MDWQTDAKNYEFWVRADATGNFKIPNVRPGTYSLHAIADGVLGDLTVTNIAVAAGKKLALGKLDWQPVRFGRQLWDIGIPNRNGSEFFKGDDYFHWGWYLQYPKLFPARRELRHRQKRFPQGLVFRAGAVQRGHEQHHRQRPRQRDDVDGDFQPARTRRTARPRCGWRFAASARAISSAAMNDQSIGTVTNLAYNATINRDGIGGSWCEHDLAFDAALMKARHEHCWN